MTAKEKASELVEKFINYASSGIDDTRQIEFESAKQCALIAVYEIQEQLKDYDDTVYDGYGYWEQVKTEINLL